VAARLTAWDETRAELAAAGADAFSLVLRTDLRQPADAARAVHQALTDPTTHPTDRRTPATRWTSKKNPKEWGRPVQLVRTNELWARQPTARSPTPGRSAHRTARPARPASGETACGHHPNSVPVNPRPQRCRRQRRGSP